SPRAPGRCTSGWGRAPPRARPHRRSPPRRRAARARARRGPSRFALLGRIVVRRHAEPLVHAAERAQVATLAGREPALRIDAHVAARVVLAEPVERLAPGGEKLGPRAGRLVRGAMAAEALHLRQHPFVARDADEAELAHLEAREGDRTDLLIARGKRIQRKLAVVGTRAEPGGNAHRAG